MLRGAVLALESENLAGAQGCSRMEYCAVHLAAVAAWPQVRRVNTQGSSLAQTHRFSSTQQQNYIAAYYKKCWRMRVPTQHAANTQKASSLASPKFKHLDDLPCGWLARTHERKLEPHKNTPHSAS
jgi:hypothetical protein